MVLARPKSLDLNQGDITGTLNGIQKGNLPANLDVVKDTFQNIDARLNESLEENINSGQSPNLREDMGKQLE